MTARSGLLIYSQVSVADLDRVIFHFNEEGDYYGGSIVTCRFYVSREETDEEYEKRLKVFRSAARVRHPKT